MFSSLPLLLLLLGLVVIVWGTRIVVDNAIAVATHHRVSDFFVGVVVLAIGSDLPEIVVSLDAAFRQLAEQQTDNLIVGNAIGSCFGQMGLVIGVAGLLGRLSLPRPQLLRHGGILLGSTLLLVLVGLNGTVTRLDGAVLVGTFAIYLYFVFRAEGLSRDAARPAGLSDNHLPRVGGVWVRLLLGLALVVASAELIVSNALKLAIEWDVDQSVIGIAIIGVGTSLPEVVISVTAVLRRRVGLTVGNLLGSNILDTLLPIGIAALIVPVDFSRDILTFDIPMLLGMTLLVLAFLTVKRGVRWPQALVVLTVYCAYLLAVARSV